MHCNQIFSKQLARMVVMTMMSSAGWEFLQSTLWGILTADFFLCLRASFIRSIFSAPAQTCQEKKFCLFFDAAQESRCMVTAPWTPNKSHVQATYNFFSPNSVFFKGWPCSRCNWIPSLPFTLFEVDGGHDDDDFDFVFRNALQANIFQPLWYFPLWARSWISVAESN